MVSSRPAAQLSLPRRFLRLTIPNILSNVTVPLAGLIDTAMLGHLPEIRYLAGVALATIIFDYVYWTLGFLRMSTTGMTAQAVGRNDVEGVMLILGRSLLVALAFAAIILLSQKAIAWAGFAVLSGTPDVEAAGQDYLYARILGAPAALCNFVFLGWFLGRERSDYALYMTLVANSANVILDYLFLFILHLAAFGAGLATMLSEYLSLVTALLLFRRLREPTNWSWRKIANRRELVQMLRLNVDITVRTFGLISAFAVFTNFSAKLGVQILAANAILLRIIDFAAYFIDGAAFATESLGGIYYGQRNTAMLRRLLRFSLGAGEAFALLLSAALLFTPAPFYRLLTSHESVIILVQKFDLYIAATLLFGALAYIYDGFFIGLLQGRSLRNSMLISTLLCFMPVALWGLYAESNAVLWASMIAFMAGRAGTLAWASRRLLKRYA